MELNQVFLAGRLTRNPERKTESMARFSIAVNRRRREEERTDFFDIICFDQQADFLMKYVKKGHAVFVDGRLAQNKWEDNEGNTRNSTDIITRRLQSLTPKEETNDAQD